MGGCHIIQLDRTERRHLDLPWRFRFPALAAAHFIRATHRADLLASLPQGGGRAVVLLHWNDAESLLRPGDLDAWLAGSPAGPAGGQPARHAILYGTNWGYEDHSYEIGNLARDPSARAHWAAAPLDHLCSPASVLGWLTHPRNTEVPLGKLVQPFSRWRAEAAGQLFSAFHGAPINYDGPDGQRPFLHRMTGSDGIIVCNFLKHVLRAGLNNNRRASHDHRLQGLLDWGDSFWLLQGVAESLKWESASALLRCVGGQIESLLRRQPLDLDDEANPDNRNTWVDVIEGVRACVDQHAGAGDGSGAPPG